MPREELTPHHVQIKTKRIKSKYEYGPTVEELQTMDIPDEFYSLTGKMRFTMLNDAMFHIVLEANPELLKSLVCSLLPIKSSEIQSLRVTNPLEFGRHIDEKLSILDVEALLNDNAIINIELQVESLIYWKERTMQYLCRLYDNVKKGANYLTVKPVVHIGIVDFDTVPEDKEFYATYHFANDRSHRIYTSKMRLSVLHLNRTDMATEEDIANHRHFWAEFFKIETWEEMLMLAEKNPIVAEATKTMYRVSAEEQARRLCEAAERYESEQRTYEEVIASTKAIVVHHESIIEEQKSMIAEQENILSNQKSKIVEQEGKITEQEGKITEQESKITEQESKITEQESKITEQAAEIARLKALLENRN